MTITRIHDDGTARAGPNTVDEDSNQSQTMLARRGRKHKTPRGGWENGSGGWGADQIAPLDRKSMQPSAET